MIFKPRLARAIVRGEKTQTRRPVKWVAADDWGTPQKGETRRYVDQEYEGPKVMLACRYQPERDYALQLGRGEAATEGVRLLVIDVRGPDELGAITEEEAGAEGFPSRDAFLAYWIELYGDVDEGQLVWVISFKAMLEDRYLTTNRDPRKGSLDSTPLPSLNAEKQGGQLVPPSWLQRDRLDREVDVRNAYRQRQQRMREEKVAAEAQLRKAVRQGSRSTVRSLTTKIQTLDGRLRNAA